MISRLIRIYTPFICALVAMIHGVFYLLGYESDIYYFFNETAGHSFCMIAYLLATSKRMCKWYKITVLMLLVVHVLNIIYLLGYIDSYMILYAGLIVNIFAIISFLIYRVTVGITKFLC